MGLSALAGPARPILLRALRQQTNDFKCDIKIKPVDCPEKFSATEPFKMTFRVTESGAQNCLPASVVLTSHVQFGSPPVVSRFRLGPSSETLTPGGTSVNLQIQFSEAYRYEIKNQGNFQIVQDGVPVNRPYDFTEERVTELIIQIDATDGANKMDRKTCRAKKK